MQLSLIDADAADADSADANAVTPCRNTRSYTVCNTHVRDLAGRGRGRH